LADVNHYEETFMPATVIQFVFKPNPGCDMTALMGSVKESAGMWKKQGADVSLWGVQVGEIGNLTFVARFDSAAKLGAALEALNNDPAFAAWRAKSVQAGLASWVRSNQAYEIPI
jgi:hypothetical protein